MMAEVRVPTFEEFASFDGAHCKRLWASLPRFWRCPGCGRSCYEIMRWTVLFPKKPEKKHMGWAAGLHRHHDHGGDLPGNDARFPETVVCEQCNSAEGYAKKMLNLPEMFSFSPEEIRQFVAGTPHGKHTVDLDRARALYQQVVRNESPADRTWKER